MRFEVVALQVFQLCAIDALLSMRDGKETDVKNYYKRYSISRICLPLD